MEIPRLSREDIIEFNKPNAFAVARPSFAEELAAGRFGSNSTVRAGTVQQSLGLLSSVAKQLGTILGNLDLMRSFAQEAKMGSRMKDERRAEVFGQLRSLSAGIDIIVRDFELEGQQLLNGARFELNSGNSTYRMNLDGVGASGPDGLGLSSARSGAWTTVDYDMLSVMRNSSTSLMGLDITEAKPVSIPEGVPELADGSYRLKVNYRGPKSSVELQDMEGRVMKRVDDVDLTGSGQELVNLGNGVQLSFEKTYVRTALGGDKYDYEQNGSTSLWALLKYERNYQQEMHGMSENYARESSVAVSRGSNIAGSTGTLTVGARVAGVEAGHRGLETGQYHVKVKYDGARSSLWLYDKSGTLVTTQRGVDLTKEGKQSFDFKNGLRVDLEGKDFTSGKRDYNVYLDYRKADELNKVFDYSAFEKRVEESIATVEAQLESVYRAQDEISLRYQTMQQAMQASNTPAFVSSGLAVSEMIAAGIEASLNPIGSFSGAENQLMFSGAEIFGSIEQALAAQANISPTTLASF